MDQLTEINIEFNTLLHDLAPAISAARLLEQGLAKAPNANSELVTIAAMLRERLDNLHENLHSRHENR